MKISIVTISFNQAKFLRECMDSVLNQDYSNFEYIVVDPGSTDGSRDIIDSYGERVIRVYEKDSGPADGLRKGFAQATGDIFYFINSDDYLLPDVFTKIVLYMKANPEVDVLLAGGLRVDETGNSQGAFYPSTVSAKSYVNGAVTLFQQGMFFKAEKFREIGGFNVENKTSWDGELLLDFILAGAKFSRLMEKVAAFRIYSESITGSQRFATQYEADQKRMYQVVYGSRHEYNPLAKMFYRLKKLLWDPKYLYMRCIG